jgi:hypothetical protein
MRLVYQQVRANTLCTNRSPTTGVCRALMVYRERVRGGVAKSNIQTGVGVVRLLSSLLPFPLCTRYPPLAYSYWGLSLCPCSYLSAICALCARSVFLISEIKLLSLFSTIALFLSYKAQFRLYDIQPRYLGAYGSPNSACLLFATS